MFLGFGNFYCRFIQSFNKITVLFILILKTSRLTAASTSILVGANVDKIVSNSSLEAILLKSKKTTIIKTKNLANLSKSKNAGIANIRLIRFLTFKAKIGFTKLRQMFI